MKVLLKLLLVLPLFALMACGQADQTVGQASEAAPIF